MPTRSAEIIPVIPDLGHTSVGTPLDFLSDPFRQFKESSEILGAVHSVNLIRELSCPDQEGLYLFQRANWIKCNGTATSLRYYLDAQYGSVFLVGKTFRASAILAPGRAFPRIVELSLDQLSD